MDFGHIFGMLVATYKTFGRETAKRMLTPPRSWVEHVCAKTGADVDMAVRERDQAVEETLQFIESLLDKDFESNGD